MDGGSFLISVPNNHGSSQAILEKVYQQLFIPRVHPLLATIHLEMVLRTSSPIILVEIRHFEFWGDDDIRYQAKICHVRERIVTKAFNSSQSLLEEIEFPSFFGRRGWSFCGQEYWLCCEVGLRQSVGCRPLDGDRGVELNIPLAYS